MRPALVPVLAIVTTLAACSVDPIAPPGDVGVRDAGSDASADTAAPLDAGLDGGALDAESLDAPDLDATSPLGDGGDGLDAGDAAPPVDTPDTGPCNGLCGAGTVCEGGVCVPIDAGAASDALDGALPDGCAGNTIVDCCGRSCSSPGNTPACRAGVCVIALCGNNGADCDEDFSNGCECQVPGAYGACRAGACVPGECFPGRGNCDGNDTNGCESTLATDRVNCGACGNVCESGTYCVDGDCRACDPPLLLCGGTCVDPRRDRANCGACDAFCPDGRTCSDGVCR